MKQFHQDHKRKRNGFIKTSLKHETVSSIPIEKIETVSSGPPEHFQNCFISSPPIHSLDKSLTLNFCFIIGYPPYYINRLYPENQTKSPTSHGIWSLLTISLILGRRNENDFTDFDRFCALKIILLHLKNLVIMIFRFFLFFFVYFKSLNNDKMKIFSLSRRDKWFTMSHRFFLRSLSRYSITRN